MDIIVKMNFGSLVYGTNLPTSDQDFKMIYIPDAKDILLGRIQNSIVSHSTKQKNTQDDVDYENYAYHYFLKLLCSGQTVALDMLFTPENHLLLKTSLWEEILSLKDKFISKSLYPFVGYCKSQAYKYSIKGVRIKEAKQALEVLKPHYLKSPQINLEEILIEYEKMIPECTHIKIENKVNKHNLSEDFLVVCGKMIPVKASFKFAYGILDTLVSQYGHRTLETEKNNYDHKALYHAFRVAYEALELLKTGHITFPNPEVSFLLDIRKGLCQYEDLQFKLDELIEEIDKAMNESNLREKPDLDLADQLVLKVYRDKIKVNT